MSLKQIIAKQISEQGPMSFRDYMESALYYPELGYYSGALEKLGPRGDYYTSPVLCELFGQMIARQLEEMWQTMGKGRFTVVEYGAGTGVLCRDVLQYLKAHSDLYEFISYCIIERSNFMRAKEEELLWNEEKVRWCQTLAELGNFKGCVLSNEVLDNFSVHQIVMESELQEICVTETNGFTECFIPAPYELRSYFEEENIKLPRGYRTEINLQAREWIFNIAQNLEEGFVLTIDYGYPDWEYYHPQRSAGTMVCYRHHRVSFNPYDHPGEQDITAHVNFSSLAKWGSQVGLKYGGFTNQCNFLRSLGLAGHIRNMEQNQGNNFNEQDLNQVMMLLNGMGNKFKVLLQHKNVSDLRLTGMMFVDQL